MLTYIVNYGPVKLYNMQLISDKLTLCVLHLNITWSERKYTLRLAVLWLSKMVCNWHLGSNMLAANTSWPSIAVAIKHDLLKGGMNLATLLKGGMNLATLLMGEWIWPLYLRGEWIWPLYLRGEWIWPLHLRGEWIWPQTAVDPQLRVTVGQVGLEINLLIGID